MVSIVNTSQNNSLLESSDGLHSTPKINVSQTSNGSPETDSLNDINKDAQSIFFAHQVVANSCATHSLLCILMNQPQLHLGPLLTEFRKATSSLSPRLKGLAIGHMPHFLRAHNRHARMQNVSDLITTTISQSEAEECSNAAVNAALVVDEVTGEVEENEGSSDVIPDVINSVAPSTGMSTSSNSSGEMDTFHFVCFLPVGKCLYELDGLKPTPINHGLLDDSGSSNDWTRQCIEILRRRMKDVSLGSIF